MSSDENNENQTPEGTEAQDAAPEGGEESSVENKEESSQSAVDDLFGEANQGDSENKAFSGLATLEDNSEGDINKRTLDAVYDVPVQVSAVLGKAEMPVHQLLKLGRGAVVELDRRVGEAIEIYVNNRLIAKGEVVVVEDRLGITMTEIIKS